MGKSKDKRDPLAKRMNETDLAWRSRLAAYKTNKRDKAEPVLPNEARQHAIYEEIFVHNSEAGEIRKVPRRRLESALERIARNGGINEDQFYAAQAIAIIVERIESNLPLSCASLEARVDCSGSGRDIHTESLHKVRQERAYTEWRYNLPIPRRMVIDMVTIDHQLANIARSYNMSWNKAKRILCEALDNWIEIEARVRKEVEQEDVDRVRAA